MTMRAVSRMRSSRGRRRLPLLGKSGCGRAMREDRRDCHVAGKNRQAPVLDCR